MRAAERDSVRGTARGPLLGLLVALSLLVLFWLSAGDGGRGRADLGVDTSAAESATAQSVELVAAAAPLAASPVTPASPASAEEIAAEPEIAGRIALAVPSRLVRGVVYDGVRGRAREGELTLRLVGARPDSIETLPVGTPAIDADGRFEVRVPGNRAALLRVRLPNGAVAERALEARPADAREFVELRAYPSALLAGRLIDLAGRPLAGFRVFALQAASGTPRTLGETRTAQDGSFRIETLAQLATDLEASGTTSLRAARWPLAQGLEPNGEEPLEFELPFVRLTVTARDDFGAPRSIGAASFTNTETSLVDCELQREEPARASNGSDGVLPRRTARGPHGGGSWRVDTGAPVLSGAATVVRYAVTAEEAARPIAVPHVAATGEAGATGAVLDRASDEQPARATFLVVPGHTYRLQLRGVDHTTVTREVSVPLGDRDIAVELRTVSVGLPVDVELVLDDPQGLVAGEVTWSLGAERDGGQFGLPLDSSSGLVIRATLPPGTYHAQLQFRHTAHPELERWIHGSRFTVEAGSAQRVVFSASDASEPIPAGFMGPGDY